MADSIRLFMLAGEPSGDRIGADLIKRLRVRERVTLSGVGGAELEGEGLKSLYPMSDLSVMGLTDVFCSSDDVDSIVAFLRAAAVTVDFWGAYQ